MSIVDVDLIPRDGAAYRRASLAVHRAEQIWPGPIGQALASLVREGVETFPWIARGARWDRLVQAIIDTPLVDECLTGNSVPRRRNIPERSGTLG